VDFVATSSGVRVVVAQLPFPVDGEEQIVEAILQQVTSRTRLALLDHVTSPTALILPLARLVSELRARNVETLVDGAHAPGMVPISLAALGAAYYTGNAHKWLCAPKGAAFLHVRRDQQAGLHPTVISHGYARGFQAEFDWTGTADPSAWLCIPDAIRFMGSQLPGGWPEIMRTNHALVLDARALLLERLGLQPACPSQMLGSMASLPLPPAGAGAAAAALSTEGLHDWFRARGVETWLYPHPVPLLRLSAQLYNSMAQFEQLARLLQEALRGN
jgi:isopenicillin-N epimerase